MAKTAESQKSLVQKLASIMKAVSPIAKTGYNDFQKYSYAEERAINAAIRMHLADADVMILPSIESIQRDGLLTTVQTEYTIIDGQSGETLTCRWAGTGSDKQDKGLYKAITGSNKYMLMKLFLLETGDSNGSDDAENPNTEVRDTAPVTQAAVPAGTADDTTHTCRILAYEAYNGEGAKGPYTIHSAVVAETDCGPLGITKIYDGTGKLSTFDEALGNAIKSAADEGQEVVLTSAQGRKGYRNLVSIVEPSIETPF
tara:strand:- start:126 stop:896 length:771 start_codon:yes stop_codon:yes gene_type:complete